MISAWQAGWEVGTATKVITDCNAWKSNHACGNGCCENGQICADPAGHLCCAAAETACGSNCCAGGQKCLDPASGTCGCATGETACGSNCCAGGQKCLDPASGTCGCATGETACGSNCCPAPEICVDAATSLCILCSDAETACGAVCCTSGKWCSSPGKSSCVDLCDGRYAVIVPGAQHDGRVSTQGEILDTQTMLRWDRYAAAVGEGTREEAAAYCRTRGMRLPTMTEALDVGYSVCAWSERWYTFTSDCMDLASGDPDGNRWSETGPKTSLCVRN